MRFSTKATLLDQNSNPLEVFTREFTIANPVLGQIENTDNNVLEGATPLVLTETPAGSGFSTVLAAGSFSTGTDSDYWRLHGEAGDHLALLLETDDWENWPYVAILNASGGGIAGSWNYYPNAGINDFVLPASGTFYLQAYSSRGRPARYQLRVDISRGPQFESEANDAPSSANALNLTTSAGNYQARVAGALTGGDTAGDYFRIPTLNVGNTIRVQLALPSCSTLNKSNVVIGVEREGSSEALATSNSGALNYVVAADGVHFVRVTADANLGLRALYLADIQVTDGQPPVITASSWPEEGTTNTGLWQVFSLSFSEDLAAGTVNDGANYELRSAGADGVFGTGDDQLYQVQCAPVYSSGLSASYWVPDGPLQPGKYRFVAKRALTDRAGNPLAADYVRQFVVAGVPGFVQENRSNETRETATVLDPLVEDGVGGGVRGGWGRGRMASNADSDWWSFTGRAGDGLSLVAETPGVNPSASISYHLYGPDGNWVWGSGTSGSPWQVGPLSLPADGTYALQVTSGNLSSPDYQFRIVLGHPPLQMESEDNGGVGSATPLNWITNETSQTASVLGSIVSSGDLDYSKLGTLTNGSTVYLSTRLLSGSQLVPVVGIYDAPGAYIVEAGAGRPFDGVAEVNITQTGDYFARVLDRTGRSGWLERYVLDLEVQPTGFSSFPNLQVVGITPPSDGTIFSGQQISFSFNVENVGRVTTPVGNWQDRVVLSSNPILGDADDLPLCTFAHSGALDPDAGYTVTETVHLPDGISETIIWPSKPTPAMRSANSCSKATTSRCRTRPSRSGSRIIRTSCWRS